MSVDLSRRKLLQHIAGKAACVAFISPATAFAIINKRMGESEDFLSFTELEGMGPEINAPFDNSNYVALHKEREVPAHLINDTGYTYAEKLLREMFNKNGWAWDKTDKLIWTFQHYGFCDHSLQCYKLLDYCISAQDFLYNTIHGLMDVNINWEILNEDFNLSRQGHNDFNGFTGRYTYLVHRISLLDKKGEIKEYGLTSATPVNRAINYITSEDSVPDTSLIYIIPGKTSLISPFSELIHISTHGPAKRLAQQLGQKYDRQQAEETSRLIGETITESAAILTAQEYLKKYQHSDRMAQIKFHENNLGSRFSLIPDTVAYMKNHGVQQTLNTFNDDPLKLINKISNTLSKN